MKKIMFVTLIAIQFASTAQAAKYKTVPAANNSNSSSMNYSSTKDTGFKFEARPGAGTAAKNFTWGINLEGKYGFKLSGNTLFVGLETGFFRTGIYSDSFQSVGMNSIPITPTVTFEMPVSNKIKLYAGTSLGLTIGTQTQSYSNNFGFDADAFGGQSNTATAFTWKFRPGMVLNDTFIAELPIGTTDGYFFFMPNVGVRF